jgi:hypothetical protein
MEPEQVMADVTTNDPQEMLIAELRWKVEMAVRALRAVNGRAKIDADVPLEKFTFGELMRLGHHE